MRCGRHCDPDKYRIDDKQNGPDKNDPEEYLVYGHFDQRNERDTKGHDTTVWLTLGPVGVWQASAWVIWGRTEVGHLVVQEKPTPWYRPTWRSSAGAHPITWASIAASSWPILRTPAAAQAARHPPRPSGHHSLEVRTSAARAVRWFLLHLSTSTDNSPSASVEWYAEESAPIYAS